MRRIYKYSIPIQGRIEIMMPQGANVLSVRMQYGEPWLWAIVDDEAPMVPHLFRMVGTGHPANDVEGAYIDQIQMQEGRLVFHLFHE